MRVDGGITNNDLCMQMQADILGIEISRPVIVETTALGAAYAAGLSVGFWKDRAEISGQWKEFHRWHPTSTQEDREKGFANWRKAIERTLNWAQ
jgi:glycerol kinase